METIRIQIDFDTAHDKYKYLFANDTEEVRNYRNHMSERGKIIKGNFNAVNKALEKEIPSVIDKALVKAVKGSATIQG